MEEGDEDSEDPRRIREQERSGRTEKNMVPVTGEE